MGTTTHVFVRNHTASRINGNVLQRQLHYAVSVTLVREGFNTHTLILAYASMHEFS